MRNAHANAIGRSGDISLLEIRDRIEISMTDDPMLAMVQNRLPSPPDPVVREVRGGRRRHRAVHRVPANISEISYFPAKTAKLFPAK